MGMERISEILKEPFADVVNDGALLGLTQYPGETNDTFRDRVAYGMQAKMYQTYQRPLSQRILDRMEALELTARTQMQEVNACQP